MTCATLGLSLAACSPGSTEDSDDPTNVPCGSTRSGDVAVNTQAEVDALAGVTEIKWNLEIGTSERPAEGQEVTSLAALRCLRVVGGELSIYDNDLLPSLQGLENLQTVEGSVYIFNQEVMTSLDGLDGLTTVGEELFVYYNPSLVDISGLNQVESVGLSAHVYGNDSLGQCQVDDWSAHTGISVSGSDNLGSCP